MPAMHRLVPAVLLIAAALPVRAEQALALAPGVYWLGESRVLRPATDVVVNPAGVLVLRSTPLPLRTEIALPAAQDLRVAPAASLRPAVTPIVLEQTPVLRTPSPGIVPLTGPVLTTGSIGLPQVETFVFKDPRVGEIVLPKGSTVTFEANGGIRITTPQAATPSLSGATLTTTGSATTGGAVTVGSGRR